MISSHLRDVVPLYITTRQERLALEKQAEEVKELEESLKKVIFAKFTEEGLKTYGCEAGTLKMSILSEPVVIDWPALYSYIQTTGAFELLHKRVANLAVKERWTEGEVVPGVGAHEVLKLTVSK